MSVEQDDIDGTLKKASPMQVDGKRILKQSWTLKKDSLMQVEGEMTLKISRVR
jgi:hypothetical protein